MLRVYDPSDFSYPLNEDIDAVYEAKLSFEKNPDSVLKAYQLKKAIYNVSLTLKSMCSIGELRNDLCVEIEDYFWGMLS